uniref:AT-rich interactive domain-containing protein 5B n=1 Tax=Cyclopterus lumpus TaxID=8103 RepID=A0A8C2YZ83_CYCLU
MEPNSLKWVGSSCGLHGPYIFYKAFKFHRDGKPRILSLGDFFFVRCKPEDPICIAELQLLWEERTSKQLLSSSKLYFLPEDTPQGRTGIHGEHEVIAVSEKVIVRLEDLVKWTVPDFSGWTHCLKAEPLKPSELRDAGAGQEEDGRKVLVLSYPQYCRFRSVLVRLREQPSSLLIDHTVLALGGIAALGGSTRILYCRDTFEHPALLQNESICDEFGEFGPNKLYQSFCGSRRSCVKSDKLLEVESASVMCTTWTTSLKMKNTWRVPILTSACSSHIEATLVATSITNLNIQQS